VERKMGTAAFTQLAIDATTWKSAKWAEAKGLFTDLYPDINALDKAVENLADTLSQSSPEAMAELKRVCWAGTEDWDALLNERAEISGKLVLSDFTSKAIEKFKAQ